MIIYIKDSTEKNKLMDRHPEVDAHWIETGIEEREPIVCTQEDGKEHCELGESFIDKFAKLEGSR